MEKLVTFYLEPISVRLNVKGKISNEELLQKAKEKFVQEMTNQGGPRSFKYSVSDGDALTREELAIGKVVKTDVGIGVVLKINKTTATVNVVRFPCYVRYKFTDLKKVNSDCYDVSIWEQAYKAKKDKEKHYLFGHTGYIVLDEKIIPVVIVSVPRTSKGKYQLQFIEDSHYIEVTEAQIKFNFHYDLAAAEAMQKSRRAKK
ncbi:hypothetical protein AB1J99_30995 [Bacillus bombysepticus]|uniref:hypothetical protein n=1 Tax=Bacillus mobilis TaxID=2026190 RepID=UPI000BF4C832|nr:hypothetical protein COI92_27075 [Bacillus anthracis]